jgi:hypothetical protein
MPVPQSEGSQQKSPREGGKGGVQTINCDQIKQELRFIESEWLQYVILSEAKDLFEKRRHN